jgi:hypothetical protein
MGFVLDPEEAQRLLDKNPSNVDVLFPFLNGEDLNGRWDQSPSRWVINFHNWPLDKAKEYPDCFEIVERLVKPERTRKRDNGDFQLRYPLYERWWQYGEKRPELYTTIKGLERVLVVAATSRTLAFCHVPSGLVYSHATYVFPMPASLQFALLQSMAHDGWVREYCSSMKGDLRYTPSDGIETFPFPPSLASLESIGERYHSYRREIMVARREGLTATYNRFHSAHEVSHDIATLRALHVEMDNAVAAAYGWTDLDLGHGFHGTKQGIRFTISEATRRTVLDRLLALNHERYAAEQAATAASPKPKTKARKRAQDQAGLF